MSEPVSSSTWQAYQQALDYLNGFIDYERKMAEVYAPEKMDPGRPARLLARLGNPHRQWPAIHIAGTKGKGSVAAMCAFCLRAAGLRVGLYTSPHLQEMRERVRILTPDDAEGLIPPERFAALVERLAEVVGEMPGLTWFELITALAFVYFAEEGVDVAVVEVGLGGRLDATNVLTPLVAVITRLGLEHTALLGNTLEEIAGEKGGIIKPGVPVVSSPQAPAALARLEEIALERNAPLTVTGREWQAEAVRVVSGEWGQQQMEIVKAPATFGPLPATFSLNLAGAHQQENALTALAALHTLSPSFPTLDREALRQGLASVEWPGRLQILHKGQTTPTLILDGAHNADSAQRLAEAVDQYDYRRLWLVLGATADKDLSAIFEPLLPLASGVFVTQAEHPRAAAPEVLRDVVERLGYTSEKKTNVETALQAAWEKAGPEDLILVTGSLFIVGDLLNCWESLKSLLLSSGE